jgi:predicted AAA+ superfamily ATPase
MGTIYERRIGRVARNRMVDESVVLLEGPRSVGKSTLLRQLAEAHHAEVIDLDDIAVRQAVEANPTLFASGPSPVCFDEYQKFPPVLDAIKAELNKRDAPGRFLLAGSTRHDALPITAQSLTGRLNRLPVYPLTQTEIEGTGVNLVHTMFEEPESLVWRETSTTAREDYIERVADGGFPLALARSSRASKNRWFDDYTKLTLERDATEFATIKRANLLPALLASLAGQTAQVLNIARVSEKAGLNIRTGESYMRLLESVFLVQRIPAWRSTLSKRATSTPKLHVVDSGVAARLLQLTPEKLAHRDPTSLTEFGHLLETFVLGELQRHASWLDGIANVSHWRTKDNDEVAVVIERDDGRVIAFEVKTGTNIPSKDLAPMVKLRNELGDRFLSGAILYTGGLSYTPHDRIHVLPLDRLWSTRTSSVIE